MLSEYLTVPLKKGFDVDLVKPIMNFIADANYSGSPTEYSVAVLELQKLRSDFIGKASDKDEKAQKILYRYIHMNDMILYRYIHMNDMRVYNYYCIKYAYVPRKRNIEVPEES